MSGHLSSLGAKELRERLLTACSVRGDAVHARRVDERVALCGVVNVNLADDEFRPQSAWACKRCARITLRAAREVAGEGEK